MRQRTDLTKELLKASQKMKQGPEILHSFHEWEETVNKVSLTILRELSDFINPINDVEEPFIIAALRKIADVTEKNGSRETKKAARDTYRIMENIFKVQKEAIKRDEKANDNEKSTKCRNL